MLKDWGFIYTGKKENSEKKMHVIEPPNKTNQRERERDLKITKSRQSNKS